MQISKFLLATCILAPGIILVARADDNPQQAAARAAVEAKMNEMVQMSPDTNTMNVVPPPMEMTNAPAVPIPMETNSSGSTPLSYQWMAASTNGGSYMPPMENTNAPALPENLTVITNAPMKPAKKTKKSKTPKSMIMMGTNAPAFTGEDLGMPPMTAPALPISMTKEQKLDELDAKYKADQISPEEYFKQRAAILSGE
jgi:hypothetical protein